MKITVIGTGYVGLVTGTCFADKGNDVWCVDTDKERLEPLRRGVIPIYEPGLAELVLKNQRQGRLHFCDELCEGLRGADLCFIAVGTPPKNNGETDMTQILQVADDIGSCLEHPCVIVTKSTVPVGTSKLLYDLIGTRLRERGLGDAIEIVSNPEFLKEGMAIDDCLCPDRVIIGAASDKARAVMKELYAPFVDEKRIFFMDPASAEITKYAANAMLATRISFMNEIARLCDEVGADVKEVKNGIAADKRIGPAFLNAGCGYGGSCFPKDVTSLAAIGEAVGVDMALITAVDKVNRQQKKVLPLMLRKRFDGYLNEKKIAILGLAFKPNTDDMREASSIALINMLVEHQAAVVAYDPIAVEKAREVLPAAVQYAASAEEALIGADAAVLVTEWPEFADIDWGKLGGKMKEKIIFDGRNFYDPREIIDLGFEYYCIGRGYTPPEYQR